ncbi:unnamed protein product [Sphagnum troendelagicum]
MESVNLHFQIQKEEKKKKVAACSSVQKLPTFIQESHNEYQYLKLIDDIIVNGSLRKVTAQAQEHSPSLAVRRNSVYQSVSNVFWHGVVEELLWFISGPTNAKEFQSGAEREGGRHADYRGQAFDRLADVIHKMWTKLDDRHIILSVWNPADVQLMALPPCHMFAQRAFMPAVSTVWRYGSGSAF